MRLRQLTIRQFGPFRKFSVLFPEEDNACVLLTGKNNEGKSSLINAIKLVSGGARVVGKIRHRIRIEGDDYFKLLQQDTEDLLIPRMIHDYADENAEITADFSGGFRINVYLDPRENIIYADREGQIPDDLEEIFGFIPPLGPLSEREDILVNEAYVRANLNTSLAPRHLRNHFYRLITRDEFELIREIVRTSWQDIELLDYEVRHRENTITAYYKEKRIEREISWAGQGLQVWFQIVTHLVRLRQSSILIFDEPEINLHPEKQNDLLRIIRDHFLHSVLIATHSVELMNNVSVSHILNIQKNTTGPKIKTTNDRAYLEVVRSQIGSNFNLVASQFDDCDVIVFTEDVFDFAILKELAEAYGIKSKAFNIPLHGFSEYTKAVSYKDAYWMLIGKKVKYSILLDRDYYPQSYLTDVKKKLKDSNIVTFFTPGKEIENLFLMPSLIDSLIPNDLKGVFSHEANSFFKRERIESWGSFLTLHKQFLPAKLDVKTITKKYMPDFEKRWEDPVTRWQMVSGKSALSWLREFTKHMCALDLPTKFLTRKLAALGDKDLHDFVKAIYQT